MTQFQRPLLIFTFVLFTASCVSLPDLFTTDDEDNATSDETAIITCEDDDTECYLDNLVVYDENFDQVELVSLTAELPAADTASLNLPQITGFTDFMMASADDPVDYLEFDWTDPNLSTPAFCMQTCPRNARCVTGGQRCTPAVRDGLTSGVWRTYLGYNAYPAPTSTTQDLDLVVTPIAATADSDEDPLDVLENGTDEEIAENVVVGESVTIEQLLLAQEESSDADDADNSDDSDSDSDATAGLSCTSSTQCGSGKCFSSRNCILSIFGNGCDCAGDANSGTCYDVSVCSSSGGTCGDGVSGCCVGYSCNNGTCESASGSCPF